MTTARTAPRPPANQPGHATPVDAPTSGDTPPVSWAERILWDVAVPTGLHVVLWLCQIGAVALLDEDGVGVRSRLLSWDSGWYIRIATEGYPSGFTYDATGALSPNAMAFFPLYPLLVSLVSWLPGVSTGDAALAVACVAGTGAAVVVSLLGTRLYSRRVGYTLCVLFSAQPMAIVFAMGYSEALFCLLVLGMLVTLHRGAWLVAGGLGFAAALTRPTGLAAAMALTAAAAWWLWRHRNRPAGTDHYPRWRPVVAALVALAGAPLYLAWVGYRAGALDAWFQIQHAGWGTRWDFGLATARTLTDAFRHGEEWVHVSTAVMIVISVILVVIALAERVWLPLSVYGVSAFALAVGSEGFYHSKPRMLVPVLLLLIPLAVGLSRTRLRVAVPIMVGFALFGCWYGAYMITVWPYTI